MDGAIARYLMTQRVFRFYLLACIGHGVECGSMSDSEKLFCLLSTYAAEKSKALGALKKSPRRHWCKHMPLVTARRTHPRETGLGAHLVAKQGAWVTSFIMTLRSVFFVGPVFR